MVDHWRSNQTQIFWTCKALAQGRVITHQDEIGKVNGWRLGAIIHKLRKQYHWSIATEYRGQENIAHYSLLVGCKRRTLAVPPFKSMMRGDHAEVMRQVFQPFYGDNDNG
ncbi:hypothetical protein [Thalassococcus lentus]|uniref:Uncharacterized protein n=1 Tax=Thalassococcus lentus TaxID=1210524 RepID=A0ABT4XMC4_9RHOB|nr:hypothetical protein [Thalassococcus lentus]MDA7423094.1 hypothetical protein [Thalassococcus lentus]